MLVKLWSSIWADTICMPSPHRLDSLNYNSGLIQLYSHCYIPIIDNYIWATHAWSCISVIRYFSHHPWFCSLEAVKSTTAYEVHYVLLVLYIDFISVSRKTAIPLACEMHWICWLVVTTCSTQHNGPWGATWSLQHEYLVPINTALPWISPFWKQF